MNYKFLDSVIYRVPAYPLKTDFALKEINSFYDIPRNKEALFLASPTIYKEFKKIRIGEKVKDAPGIYETLLKYTLRTHSRCTPFGLFASCGTTKWYPDALEMIHKNDSSRSTRLDMHYSVSFAMKLARDENIKPLLRFFPNSSLYPSGEKLRYVEYYYHNKRRVHQISAVQNSEYLQKILEQAKSGKTISELASAIVSKEITLANALEFLEEIIDNQLLVSEIEPGVTGNELMSEILKTLIRINQVNPSGFIKKNIEIIKTTLGQIAVIDTNPANPVEAYQKISRELKQTNVDFEESKLFQTDLFSNENTSGPDVKIKRKLFRTMKVLNKLNSNTGKTNLSVFKEKFYARYEEQEVPLLVALDNEMGIGYAASMGNASDVSPLLENIVLPYRGVENNQIRWNQKEDFLFSKLLETMKNKKRLVKIDLDELKSFDDQNNELPLSLSVMFTIPGIENKKIKILFNGAGGSSATNLLGRFASGNPQIKEVVNEIVNAEDKLVEDKILAEISHLPENRVGNILMRPVFRKYEIPYLSNSSLANENQINLRDLTISVPYGKKIILKSKKLGKEVLPRMSNAHNFSHNALPVYQFLCDLQASEIQPGISFSWGSLQNHFTFLPRVEIEEVIVSSACWRIKEEDYKSITDTGDKFEMSKITKWLNKFRIDEKVLLVEGDNKLPINFKNENCVKMFLNEIKKKRTITLEEFLYDQYTPYVKTENGTPLANEFIAPMIKIPSEKDKDQKIVQTPLLSKTKVKRSFSIGEEWIYYKLYCGVKTADEVLTTIIQPVANRLLTEKIIDKWFFIRYGDPDNHIRIRFHLSDITKIGEVILLFQQKVNASITNGLVWKLQTDTYQRELERYGSNTIKIAESLFFIESDAICKMLALIEGDEGEQIRWQFCMRAIDQFFTDFQYTLDERLNLITDLKTAFAKEFNSNKHLTKQIDKKYRQSKEAIQDTLNRENGKSSDLLPLFEILNKKSQRSEPFINELINLNNENKLEVPLDNLISSFIHMLLNRLFRNNQRVHELIIYDFIWRWYRTQKAMALTKRA